MSDRDIKSHIEKAYNVEVSPDLVSRVTNEVIEEVRGEILDGGVNAI